MRRIGPAPIIAIVVSLVVVILAAVYLYPVFALSYGLRAFISERQKQLVYHTDHALLAGEARAFANQWRSRFGMPGAEPKLLWPDDGDVPSSLRTWRPTSIRIFNDRIELEFGGAPMHYGIVVFDEDFEGYGTNQLAKGVWFYSEDGRYPGPNGEREKGPPSNE